MSSLEAVVGEVVRQTRQRHAMTQRELAFLTHLDPMTISRIERGVRLPSLTSMLLIAKALDTAGSSLVAQVELRQPDLVLAEPVGNRYRKRGLKKGATKQPPGPNSNDANPQLDA
jgi:transcriptional regulator with XRE-family HTH domain